jgi:hypothetical protein
VGVESRAAEREREDDEASTAEDDDEREDDGADSGIGHFASAGRSTTASHFFMLAAPESSAQMTQGP